MSPVLLLSGFLIYTLLLFLISRITARRASNESYFLGNQNSPWYIVAYGMIGATLSGVTFMSVPGLVKAEGFSYMMLVFGYLTGYFVIGLILLPLYYRLKLTSIYTYLEQRFGMVSYKTGASYFILSRLIGASFRMFLVVNVLQLFIFDAWNIPFGVTVALFMLLILLYTLRGGIKTIVWTDTLQTTFMISAVIITIIIVGDSLGMSIKQMWATASQRGYMDMVITDIADKRYYLKQFFAGLFITIVMTGLDQDMMQKNLSCRTLGDSQKNVFTFGFILIPINILFLFLGAVLWLYADQHGIVLPNTSDDLFATVALKYLGIVAGLTFFFGLVSAAYSSADGTLTALTTVFCVDILGLRRKPGITEEGLKKIRYKVHLAFSIVVLMIIIGYRAINDTALISKLFTIAGYTYGPLLGLYFFGLFSQRQVRDRWVPLVCILSPVLSYLLSTNSQTLLWGYKFGFEILIINGFITGLGLFILSWRMGRQGK